MTIENQKPFPRPWRIVAAEAATESNPGRVLELIEELNAALEADRAQRKKVASQSNHPASNAQAPTG